MFELLKEKSTGKQKETNCLGLFFGCLIILIAFI